MNAIRALRSLIVEILKDESEVVLYHASPQRSLTQLRARYSPKFGRKGVFVSKSMESMWNSWISWALSRPQEKTGRADDKFEEVTLYTLRMPRSAFEEAEKLHFGTMSTTSGGGVEAIGAWGWDVETFIPEELVPELTITSKKTYSKPEVLKIIQSRQGWKKAGFVSGRSGELPYHDPKRNPARRLYNELEEEIIQSDLKRGGMLGGSTETISNKPSSWRMDQTVPSEMEVKKLMGRIRDMTGKSHLSPAEKSDLTRYAEKIRSLISSMEKEPLAASTSHQDYGAWRRGETSKARQRFRLARRGRRDKFES
jgi:hypothetical protein